MNIIVDCRAVLPSQKKRRDLQIFYLFYLFYLFYESLKIVLP